MTTAAEKLDEGDKVVGEDSPTRWAGTARLRNRARKQRGPRLYGTAIGTAAATPPDKSGHSGAGWNRCWAVRGWLRRGSRAVFLPAARAAAPAPHEGSNFIGDLSAAAARSLALPARKSSICRSPRWSTILTRPEPILGRSLIEELAASIKAHGLLATDRGASG